MRQVEILKAIADENRLRILNLLSRNLLCVCEIETMLELNQSNISRHLAKLRKAGIIIAEKDAQWVHYKIDTKFKKEHPGLWRHMEKIFLESTICASDNKRYDNYIENGFTCKDIQSDKGLVLENIKETQSKIGSREAK